MEEAASEATSQAVTPPTAAHERDADEPRMFLNPFAQARATAKLAEAEEIGSKMTGGARFYFASEQQFSAPDGSAPWHSGARDDLPEARYQIGMPVPFTSYVFPGGASFTLTTHDAIPRGGKKAPLTLDISRPDVAAVLNHMRLSFERETYFRYTYTTGPGVGKEATATILAEADFDPSTPQVHTILYTLHVDAESEEVVISEPIITHEFH